ncbi:hypothetical protein [Bacillus wiedmannii]|uniref:hypothetical protein n=1 Tax=Bacillus wiedmannii TaxID=1890302 RepID=UPI00211D683D|nr:hypothetical protein [Bacillus wiedmannii]
MACSEQEGVGSPDEEALFASQEGMKRPTVLATEHSSRWNWIKKSGSGLLRMRRCQCKEWKQQRFIKNKIESHLLSKRKKLLMKI